MDICIECHLSWQEAIQLVKDYTSECVWLEVEYYLGLTPKGEQSFQGLIDHLSLTFQSCEMILGISTIGFKNQGRLKMLLQILVRNIVAHKAEFLGETNQALKHQYLHDLRDPYFRLVARVQFMCKGTESWIRHQCIG